MKDIIVGISGGVDSAVTALLLKENGYNITGIHLNINGHTDPGIASIEKIRKILGINIIDLDVSKRFQNTVIQHFREEHLKGRSPSPCTVCNPGFKWQILIEHANLNGIKNVASGHYIQKVKRNGKWWLTKSVDSKKDQSYFLWGLRQEQIDRLCTPLGIKTKDEIKKIARNNHLDFLIKKKESTGLCFANGLTYVELLEKHIPEIKEITPGYVVDSGDNIIGRHRGYIYYTVGQKRGLSLYEDKGFCVTGINVGENKITAGSPRDLWKKVFYIHKCNFVDEGFAIKSSGLSVKIRGFGWNPKGTCEIQKESQGIYKVSLENPAWAPAPGQPAVFYKDDLIVGGGIITTVNTVGHLVNIYGNKYGI